MVATALMIQVPVSGGVKANDALVTPATTTSLTYQANEVAVCPVVAVMVTG